MARSICFVAPQNSAIAGSANIPLAALSPRQITPVLPEASMAEGAVWLTLPAELEYPL